MNTQLTGWRARIVDLAERGVSSFLEVFLGALVAAAGVASVPWETITGQALGALVVAELTAIVLWLSKVHLADSRLDLVLRVVLTFGQSLTASLVVGGVLNAFTFHWTASLKVAAIASAGALLKGISGYLNPSTLGASTFVHARVVDA